MALELHDVSDSVKIILLSPKTQRHNKTFSEFGNDHMAGAVKDKSSRDA